MNIAWIVAIVTTRLSSISLIRFQMQTNMNLVQKVLMKMEKMADVFLNSGQKRDTRIFDFSAT